MSGAPPIGVIGVGSPIIDLLAPAPFDFMDTVPGARGGMELVSSEEMDQLAARLPAPPQFAPGGSAANTVCTLLRLGVPGALLGKTGEDAAGYRYRDAFAGLGGDCSRLKSTPEKPTARCLSLITPDGERTMRTDLGAAMLLAPGEVAPADFSGYTHAHLEGYMLFNEPLTRQVIASACGAGCSLSLDLGSFEVVRQNMGVLPGLLRDCVDIVFANEEEARVFAGSSDPDEALEALGAVCPVAVVKLGARGALVRHRGRRLYIPAVPAERVMDTTGAGDCWAGGFLFGCLQELCPERTGHLAALIGALTVECLGASPREESWERICRAAAEIAGGS